MFLRYHARRSSREHQHQRGKRGDGAGFSLNVILSAVLGRSDFNTGGRDETSSS